MNQEAREFVAQVAQETRDGAAEAIIAEREGIAVTIQTGRAAAPQTAGSAALPVFLSSGGGSSELSR